jgi:hypothetical protein
MVLVNGGRLGLTFFGGRAKTPRTRQGETHMQKATFFLQELIKVPLGFEFLLYKHGPFSFDLRDELTFMRAQGFLRLEPQYPYGPTLVGGEVSCLSAHFSQLLTSIFSASGLWPSSLGQNRSPDWKERQQPCMSRCALPVPLTE